MLSEATETFDQTRPAVTQRKRLRVGVFGGFGIGNFGNDASLEAVLNYLRAERPDIEIGVICSKPAVVSERYGVTAVATAVRPTGVWRLADTLLLRQPSTWINWVRCLYALRRFDLVLVAGTGVFDDFRDTPLGWPSRLLRWCLAARLRGVKLAYLSVGGGPILSPISRQMMKWAAQLADYRSYRDEGSRAYMQSIGVDESESPVLPDLAFLLPAPAEGARTGGTTPTVGVGLMNYRGWRDSDAVYNAYVETHARLIEWLESGGCRVRVLIGQTPTDLTAVRDVGAALGRDLQTELELNSIHDVMNAVSETDFVIASRYHVQVAALKMGRPVISLSYAPKNDALLAAAGLGQLTQDVHAIDLDALKRQIADVRANREHYAEIVRTRVSAMDAQFRGAFEALDALAARPAPAT